MRLQADTFVNKQLLSDFEAEFVADTKQLKNQRKIGVSFKKTCITNKCFLKGLFSAKV